MSLPEEIILRILKEVIGGSVLHIDDAVTIKHHHLQVCTADIEDCGVQNLSNYQISTCCAHKSEQQAYVDFVLGSFRVPEHDEPKYYSGDLPSSRHDDCLFYKYASHDPPCDSFPISSKPASYINVLLACKKMSRIGFEVFWSCNTFSFLHMADLATWLPCLTPQQKGSMTKLHVFAQNHEISNKPCLEPAELRMLSKVTELHLYVRVGPRAWIYTPNDTSKLRIRDDITRNFLRLEVLPLKEVTVTVQDNGFTFEEVTPYSQRFNNRETLAEKQDLGMKITKILLNPDGAKLAAKEEKLLEIERSLKAAKKAMEDEWSRQLAEF